MLQSELGRPWQELFITLTPEPIAAASLGQVYKGTLANGDTVAVKVGSSAAGGGLQWAAALPAAGVAGCQGARACARTCGGCKPPGQEGGHNAVAAQCCWCGLVSIHVAATSGPLSGENLHAPPLGLRRRRTPPPAAHTTTHSTYKHAQHISPRAAHPPAPAPLLTPGAAPSGAGDRHHRPLHHPPPGHLPAPLPRSHHRRGGAAGRVGGALL
jgi:hypothetical protein